MGVSVKAVRAAFAETLSRAGQTPFAGKLNRIACRRFPLRAGLRPFYRFRAGICRTGHCRVARGGTRMWTVAARHAKDRFHDPSELAWLGLSAGEGTKVTTVGSMSVWDSRVLD